MAEFVVDFYSEHDGVKCEPIVRCMDCEMCETYALVGSELHICKRFDEYWHTTDENGFCAWGKRRTEQ